MTDEDIDLSDCPEITPEMFAKAVVRRGLPIAKVKTQVTLRIDSDVLDWFSLTVGAIKHRLINYYEPIWKPMSNCLSWCCV